jgi:N5-(carboxyethyl)ornithine synthase
MKRNSLIIDVSCDKNGAIETSIPTTIENPTYSIDGIMHYVVDHTPAIFYKTFTTNNSSIIYPFIEQLILENYSSVLQDAMIIKDGIILDQEINEFQNREIHLNQVI